MTLGAAVGPLLLGSYVVMALFMQPAWNHWGTWIVLALFVAVAFIAPRPADDLPLFVVSCLLGFFVELWGTSRGVWTYWTLATPPLAAVLGHGVGSVGFHRILLWLRLGWIRLSTGRWQASLPTPAPDIAS